MNTKVLSNRALSVIDQYLHFKIGNAVCSIPYYNNKTLRVGGPLRAYKGKGSPKDIFEEVESIIIKQHLDINAVADESLKKLLTDNNIGIDCSGFAYYVLNAENQERKKGPLDKQLSFTSCKGFMGKIVCSLRPAENCDVATFAHKKNSNVIATNNIEPGDYISMVGGSEGADRNHILVIHQVEYQNFIPIKLHYSHAVAYPEDGLYGTGIKQGTIEIVDLNKPITDARWIENSNEGDTNRIHLRAKISKTEIRRLRWF